VQVVVTPCAVYVAGTAGRVFKYIGELYADEKITLKEFLSKQIH
jgi:hypothetical protein